MIKNTIQYNTLMCTKNEYKQQQFYAFLTTYKLGAEQRISKANQQKENKNVQCLIIVSRLRYKETD